MLFDLPLDELRAYQAPDAPPADFDEFWRETLAAADRHPLDAKFDRVIDGPYKLVDVFDVTYRGWNGDPIRGWLLTPADVPGPLPCLVRYVGYGGGRGMPVEHLAPVVAGFAHFVMDTRGQGAAWASGDTPDPVGSGPHYPGFMTQGIASPETYYYRRVYVDAVRAVRAATQHDRIDAGRVGVIGGSQGGGIALAVAGLIPDSVKLLLADVPFLCHFRRATNITDAMPYAEIVKYLMCHRGESDRVLDTLDHFDGIHFAPRIRARCLLSVGLRDLVCPPSTVFAAYNRISAAKEISVYKYNEHEGGGMNHLLQQLRFATLHL